jgi:hypothetical protein
MAEKSASGLSLADRLAFGVVTVPELQDLKQCGRTTIYEDIRAGVLPVIKQGRSTRISGPVARDYVPGARHRVKGAA